MLLVTIGIHLYAYGQTESSRPSDQEHNSIPPKFRGGGKRVIKIIEDNLIYPEEARIDKVGGRVTIRFLVDTFGNATNIEVIKGVREDIDQEAVRLVGLLNDWIPGMEGGVKKKCYYLIPLTFTPGEAYRKAKKDKKHTANSKKINQI